MTDFSRMDWLPGLRKFSGFRGQTSFSLGEDVLPVTDVATLQAPFHQSVGGGLSGLSQAALAANVSYCGLYLSSAALGASRRCVVKYILISIPAAVASNPVFVGVFPEQAAAAIAFTSALALGSWDSVPMPGSTNDRIVPAVRTVIAQSVTSVLNGGNSMIVAAPGDGGNVLPLKVDGPFVLAPGALLLVQTQAVNLGLRCGFYSEEYDVG